MPQFSATGPRIKSAPPAAAAPTPAADGARRADAEPPAPPRTPSPRSPLAAAVAPPRAASPRAAAPSLCPALPPPPGAAKDLGAALAPALIEGVPVPRHPSAALHAAAAPPPGLVPTASLRALRRAIALLWLADRPVLIEGPPGAGKTAAVRALAAELGAPMFRVSISELTSEEDLFGRLVPDPHRRVAWQDGPVTRAMRDGGVLVLDELNLGQPGVLASLNGVLDGRFLRLEGHDAPVSVHPSFRVFATVNPADVAGRRPLPPDLASRFEKLCVAAPTDAELLAILEAFAATPAGRDLPMQPMRQLVAAQRALQALVAEEGLGDASGGLALSLRDLLKVARRAAHFAPTTALTPAALVAREACEVLLGGLHDPEDTRRARAALQGFLPAAGDAFTAGLRLVEHPDGWQLGDVIFPSAAPRDGSWRAQVALTPRVLEALYRLRKADMLGEPVALVGERAGGKTLLTEIYAQLVGKHFERLVCSENTDERALMGSWHLDGWHDGALPRALRQPTVLLADEFNTLPAATMDRLNALHDGETHLVLAEKDGSRLPLAGMSFIAAMNPSTYEGRHPVSEAMLNRLTLIAVEAPTAALELEAIGSHALAGSALSAGAQASLTGALVALQRFVHVEVHAGRLGGDASLAEPVDYSLRQMLSALKVATLLASHTGDVAAAFAQAAGAVYVRRSPVAADQAALETEIAALAAGLAPRADADADADADAPGALRAPAGAGATGAGGPDDVASSVGQQTYADGSTYDGELRAGERHGQGTFRDGERTYAGTWAHGEMHGQGILYDAEGGVYRGAFVAGQRSGLATHTYADGSSVTARFEGDRIVGAPLSVSASRPAAVAAAAPHPAQGAAQGSAGPGEAAAAAALAKRPFGAVAADLHAWAAADSGVARERLVKDLLTVPVKGTSAYVDARAVSELPDALFGAPGITSMTVVGHGALALPAALMRATNLQSLSLHHFSGSHLGRPLTDLATLKNLTLHQLKLEDMPAELGHMTGLTSLSFHWCRGTALPASVTQLTALQGLTVGNTPIVTLPEGLGALHDLRTLLVSKTAVARLPESVDALAHLTRLDLRDSPLQQLPASITRLVRLRDINLARTQVTDLPQGLRALNVIMPDPGRSASFLLREARRRAVRRRVGADAKVSFI